jgi:hypothetical protein
MSINFYGEDKLTCLAIAAQRKEYRFAKAIGFCIIEQTSSRLVREREDNKRRENELFEQLKKANAINRNLEERLF